jgi:imidazolonepropionase-like amidohydrolase
VFAVRTPHLFDGEAFRSEGGTVLVDDGRIVGVEPASAVLPEGCPVTEFAGATVLPGLIDMHVHCAGTPPTVRWTG